MNATDRAVILEAADMAGDDTRDFFEWMLLRSDGLSYEIHTGMLLGAALVLLRTKPGEAGFVRELIDEVLADYVT